MPARTRGRRAAGLRSVPARLGVARSLQLAAACHLGMVLLLLLLPLVYPLLGAIYLAGIVAVGLLLAYEHWLVRPDDLTRVNTGLFSRQCGRQHGAAGRDGPGFID